MTLARALVVVLATLTGLQAQDPGGPNDLLQTSLADRERPQDVAALEKMRQRVEAGVKKVAGEVASEEQKALLGHLQEQLTRLDAHRALLASSVPTASQLRESRRELERKPAPGPPVDVPSEAQGDPGALQAALVEAKAAADGLANRAKTAVEDLQRLEELEDSGPARKATLSGSVTRLQTAWETARKEVTEAEKKGENGLALRVSREAAWSKALALGLAEARRARLEEELRPEVLRQSLGLAELKSKRAEEASAAAQVQIERLGNSVRRLAAEAQEDRAAHRARIEQEREAAASWAQAYHDLRLRTLEMEGDRDTAVTKLAEWKTRFAAGGRLSLYRTDADEANQEFGDDDLSFTTDELRVLLARYQEARGGLAGAHEELGQERQEARLDQQRAILVVRDVDRNGLEKKRKAAAELAPAEFRNAEELGKKWDAAARAYRKAAEGWRNSAKNLREETADDSSKIGAAVTKLDGYIAHIHYLLLWSQEESHINLGALKQALEGVQNLPGVISDGVTDTVTTWWEAVRAEENRLRAVAMAVLAILMIGLLWLTHQKLPSTYSWLEARTGDDTGILMVLATGIRRTEFVFMAAVFYCGLCAVWMQWPWATGPVAVIALTPFCYRFARVLLDVLFHPTHVRDRLIDVPNELAQAVTRVGQWVINLSLGFVPVGLLLNATGYGAENPGFVELWWFIYTTSLSVVMLVGLFRPAVLRRLIRGTGHAAASVRTLILVVYPLVVASALYLLVLHSLRYQEAVRFFRIRFLATIGIVSVGWFVYRWLLRKLLPGRDFSQSISQDDYDSDEKFFADGRRDFYDRLGRLGVRLLIFLPALVLFLATWRRMDWAFLDAPLFGEGGTLTGGELLAGVLAIWITVVALRHYRRWMRFVLLPATKLDQGLGYAVLTLTSYVLLSLGAVVTLNILEVDGSQIAWVLSALMVGIGFGLKDLINNFISGVLLLVERPLKVGDQVVIGDQLGRVEKINLRSTTIITFDNVGVVVPNADLVTGTLVNRSSGTPFLRTTLPVGVSYDADVRDVYEILEECLQEHGLVLKRPEPVVYFVGFGDNSLDFSVRFWARMTDNRMRIAGDLRASILSRFRDAGIEIPFPQRDIHIRSDDADMALPGSETDAKARTDSAPPGGVAEDASKLQSAEGAPDSGADGGDTD